MRKLTKDNIGTPTYQVQLKPPDPSDPHYYTKKGIEPWDFIYTNKLDFLEGNIVKYIARWRQKGGIRDLMKARTYLDKLIQVNEEQP